THFIEDAGDKSLVLKERLSMGDSIIVSPLTTLNFSPELSNLVVRLLSSNVHHHQTASELTRIDVIVVDQTISRDTPEFGLILQVVQGHHRRGVILSQSPESIESVLHLSKVVAGKLLRLPLHIPIDDLNLLRIKDGHILGRVRAIMGWADDDVITI